MINREELQALADLLNRTLMTAAERMWCQGLLDRLQEQDGWQKTDDALGPIGENGVEGQSVELP